MDSFVSVIVAVVALAGTVTASLITFFSAKASGKAQRELSERKADQEDVTSLRMENRSLREEVDKIRDDYVGKVEDLREQVYKLRKQVWDLQHVNGT